MRTVRPVIHDGNIHAYRAPQTGPSLNISALHQLDCDLAIRGFAIKYVLEGTEHYTVNGDPFPVHTGQYLLANRHATTHVGIKSDRAVKGLCIDLTTELIDEVARGSADPEGCNESDLHSFFTSTEFLESTNEAGNTSLGPVLGELAHALFSGALHAHELDKAMYYSLAERVVQDHRALLPRLRSVQAVRPGTRKDLYRRVQRAKAFMDSSFHLQLGVADFAREAAMSEYHFFRVFRAVTGTTPHRYLLARRLMHAHTLLQQGHGSIADIALRAGFSDAAGFTKAFRKFHGFVPSDTIRGSGRI